MKTQRDIEHERGARRLLIILASCAVLVVGAIFAIAANAQSPQDFKVCSDTSCVQIIVTPVVPACPAQPAPQTQPGVCPAGTTGTWTQTQTYSSVPAPTCWSPSGYLPIAPPAGSCVATAPPVPGAPANLAASFVANATNPANSNVTLTWAAVAGVTEYEVWRCSGPTCNPVFLDDATTNSYSTPKNNNLPPNTTFKFKVRAWKPVTGPYSTVLTVVTPTNAPPPPPPAGTGTASLEWTHDGVNLAGFRVVYGTSANALTQIVQVPVPAVRTYVVDKLSTGTWFFAVRAYNSAGAESVNSNVASKQVP